MESSHWVAMFPAKTLLFSDRTPSRLHHPGCVTLDLSGPGDNGVLPFVLTEASHTRGLETSLPSSPSPDILGWTVLALLCSIMQSEPDYGYHPPTELELSRASEQDLREVE
jgi:hypothetical protein